MVPVLVKTRTLAEEFWTFWSWSRVLYAVPDKRGYQQSREMVKGVLASRLRTSGQSPGIILRWKQSNQVTDLGWNHKRRSWSSGGDWTSDHWKKERPSRSTKTPPTFLCFRSETQGWIGRHSVTGEIYFEVKFSWRHPKEPLPEVKSNCCKCSWFHPEATRSCLDLHENGKAEQRGTVHGLNPRRMKSIGHLWPPQRHVSIRVLSLQKQSGYPGCLYRAALTGSCHCCFCEIPPQDQCMKRKKQTEATKTEFYRLSWSLCNDC